MEVWGLQISKWEIRAREINESLRKHCGPRMVVQNK